MPISTLSEPVAVVIEGPSGALEVHAAMSLGHSKSVEATQHPVEEGVAITDHLRPKPDKLSMNGHISDIPPLGTDGDVEAGYAFLTNLAANPELVTISTRLQNYESMALVSLSVPDKADVGASLEFTAEFQYVRVVSVKKAQRIVKKGARKKTGKVETKDPPKPKQTSSLKRLTAASDRVKGLMQGLGR